MEWRSLKAEVKSASASVETLLANTTQATENNEKRVKELATNVKTRTDAIEKEMRDRTDGIEMEIRGRTNAVMGAMIGTLHSRPYRDPQDEEEKDWIAEAIHHIRSGYEILRKLEGRGKYMALNNLVYFTCLLGDKADRDEMLTYGREMLRVGRQSGPSYAAPYLMTYCRVALVYSSDRAELEQAKAIAQKLEETAFTKLQKREATFLVASLTKSLMLRDA